MSPSPLILLPPSEGKASGGDGAPLAFDSISFVDLNKERALMIKALGQLSGKPRVAQRLLGVKGIALEKARSDNAEVLTSPTKPAIERYTGVMYDSIDYQSLDADAKQCFGENTIIMSGLFGAVRPFDLIPNYKLKMGAKLRRSKACAVIWKPQITKSLLPIARDRVIWDLLPNEHSAAWDPAQIGSSMRLTVKFLEDHGSKGLKTVNHWSKALKGALIRFLVANPERAGQADSALELLGDFSHPEGYEYAPDHTKSLNGETALTFLKVVS